MLAWPVLPVNTLLKSGHLRLLQKTSVSNRRSGEWGPALPILEVDHLVLDVAQPRSTSRLSP